MSKSAKRDKHGETWTFMILMVAFETVLLMGFFRDAFGSLFTHLSRISVVLGFVLPYSVCMTARQLGNIALARATGRDFVSFQIGKWVLVRQRGRISFKHAQWASWPEALIIPADGRISLAQTRWYFLSGAQANLCLSALSYALFLRLPASGGWSMYLLIQFPMALFFVLWEGIPHHICGNPSAALMAIQLKDGQDGLGSSAQVLCAQAMCHMVRGESLGQIPDEQFVLSVDEASRADWIAYYKLIHLMDMGNEQAAHDWAVCLLSGDRQFPYAVRMEICGLLLVDRMLGMDIPKPVEMPDAGEIEGYFEYDADRVNLFMLRYAQAMLEQHDENSAARIRTKLEHTLKTAYYIGDPARYIRRLDSIKRRYEETNAHGFSSSAGAAE